MKLYSVEAMRAADARAVELGYPSILLMEAAGRAVAAAVSRNYPNAKQIAVAAGKGNNGGDGLVAARWLHFWGYKVVVYAPEGHKGDAALARAALAAHLPIHPLAETNLDGVDVVVDALFGTGLSRPAAGDYAVLIEKINHAAVPAVAIDVPSGLPYKPFVKAELTVALAGLKPAHVFYPDRAACGKILLAPIGLPPEALEQPNLPDLTTPEEMRALLPTRPGNAHKGSVGRVLVAGGALEYTGAPTLAALGAYKAGAGLVTVAYPAEASIQPPLEAVRLPVASWTNARLFDARAEAVAVGMGGGTGGGAAARAALKLKKPTVLDADALHPEVVRAYTNAVVASVITPHPGEAARFLGEDPQNIASDPLRFGRELAERFKTVVVLKGGPTVVCQPGRCSINTSGNPAMASGGMGDVLAGVIAALLAAGLPPYDAAKLGVYLHGLAGDQVGRIGLTASELATTIPTARLQLESGLVKSFWE